MNTHDSISNRLSEYIDGELSPAEQATIERHLASCGECRAVVADLRTIVTAARRLPDVSPERELWDGVSQRMDVARVVGFRARVRRRFSFTVPQLAAAGIAIMLASGGVVYLMRPEPPAVAANPAPVEALGMDAIVPVALVDPHYDGAVSDLERTLAEGRKSLDPETVRVLEQNLAAIDTAIEESRRALEADPANAFLNSHLLSARQRKLALLRRATALTTGS